MVTEVERAGRAPLAIFHDEQLSEEPELLRAAGAVALLAAENAELESAWDAAWRTCGIRARGRSWPATESGAGSSAISTTAYSSDSWPC